MGRLLLDAHVVIWWDTGSPALGGAAKKAIQHADAVYVSAASEWEVTIKTSLGKIRIDRTILDAVQDAGFEPLPVSFQHAHMVGQLKPIHKDPFDRLLIAAALVEGLTLVTADVRVAQYGVNVIDARR